MFLRNLWINFLGLLIPIMMMTLNLNTLVGINILFLIHLHQKVNLLKKLIYKHFNNIQLNQRNNFEQNGVKNFRNKRGSALIDKFS